MPRKAEIFDGVMQCLWDVRSPKDLTERALRDTLRGRARTNPENALEVLTLVYPEQYTFDHVRLCEGDTAGALFTVKFDDGSACLIEAPAGIGSSVEVL